MLGIETARFCGNACALPHGLLVHLTLGTVVLLVLATQGLLRPIPREIEK